MKRRQIVKLSSRTIKAYVRDKLRGLAERNKEREAVRQGKKRENKQERLFE